MTAWSGYQGFCFGGVAAAPPAEPPDVAAPVVMPLEVPDDLDIEPPLAAAEVCTGSFTNLILSNGTAIRRSPTPRKPPTPITTALMLPSLSVSRSLIEPRLSLASL